MAVLPWEGRTCWTGAGDVEVVVEKLLLTPVEAAAALGVGRSKVYELMRSGDLPSVRIGACRRIPAEGLMAFLSALLPAR